VTDHDTAQVSINLHLDDWTELEATGEVTLTGIIATDDQRQPVEVTIHMAPSASP
jgi:hypothetical protein